MGVAPVDRAVLVVDDLQAVGPERRDGVAVAGREGGFEAGGVGASGIASHAAEGRCGPVASHQLVEARERRRRVLDVEALPAGEQAVGAEEHELELRALVGQAADALGAGAHVAEKEGIGLECEDVDGAPCEAVDQVEEGLEGGAEARRTVQRAESDGAMVDDLDVGGESGCQALEVERCHVGGDRVRPRCGAGACRPLGQQLGIALV